MTAAHGRPKPGEPLSKVTPPAGCISLIFSPVSVIIGERWYRFKRDRGFVVHSAETARRKGYTIERIRPATAEDIEYLEGNIGSDWSWLHNCVTVMAGPLDQRWSIAGRVSAILLAAALALGILIGVGAGVDSWMDSKIEKLKRSNAAHFGQIKKSLKELER